MGGAKIFGVFRVRNHDFTPKNHIFSNFRGGARVGGAPPPGSAPGNMSQTIEDLSFLYTVHMINSLQSDFTGLVVKGQFDKETTSLFKCLERNTNQFKPESLENLKTAAEISVAKCRVNLTIIFVKTTKDVDTVTSEVVIIPDTTEEVIKITSVVIQGVIHRDRTFQKTEKMEISMLLLPVLN